MQQFLRSFRVLLLAAALVATACNDVAPGEGLPDPDSAAVRYGSGVEGEIRGNVLQLEVPFGDELRRGGPIWARGGPYFYLFTGATRDLFEENPQLAGVRVITRTPDGEEVARATLERGRLREHEWNRARNLAGRAQLEGTERPRLVEQLVFFGEDHTEHEYNEDFVPPLRRGD